MPYDEGWQATVNGAPAPVLKVDKGLMAIPCPAGEAEIRCDYHTPGLDVSLAICGGSLAVYGLYLALLYRAKKKAAAQ